MKPHFLSLKMMILVCGLWSLVCGLSACVRLTGSAGVWKQGAEEDSAASHQVGFDTNNALPQSSKANITT